MARPTRWWRLAACIVSAAVTASLSQTTLASAGSALLSQEQFIQARTDVSRDGADFAGYSADRLARSITVYRVASRRASAGSQAIMNEISNLADSNDGSPKTWNVSIVDVKYSQNDLAAIQQEIPNREPWSSISSPYLSIWYVDPASNAVVVGLTSVTGDIQSQATASFGDRVRLITQARAVPLTRNVDFPPYWGGSVITGSGHGCTSGFPAFRRSNGHHGLLTAGHCFPLNSIVDQDGALYGTVTWRVYGGGNYDAEFVDTSASGNVGDVVYDGCDACATNVTVLSYFPVGAGDATCTDGAVNLENCNATVQETNLCVVYSDGQTVCHLDGATSDNGSWIVQIGDSGGPVYIHNGGGVDAQGTISGGVLQGNGGTTVYFTDFAADLNATFKLDCSGVC
jgi:hypothetical protein